MLIEFPPLKLWKSLTHSWGVAWALGKPCCQDSFLKALDSWRGWGGRRTIIFHRLQPLQEDACSNGHVSLVYWLWPFLLRNSFVFSKCNLCCTWSSDNADDPAFDVQSSLLRYCCPLLGSSPILVGEKKKKKERNNGDKFRHWWEKKWSSLSTPNPWSYAHKAISCNVLRDS